MGGSVIVAGQSRGDPAGTPLRGHPVPGAGQKAVAMIQVPPGIRTAREETIQVLGWLYRGQAGDVSRGDHSGQNREVRERSIYSDHNQPLLTMKSIEVTNHNRVL